MTIPILICDDSKFAQKQMVRALPENWDVQISYASDGVEGLDVIRKGLGNIVFLDLNMPNMDGYGVLEAIQSEDLPALVIVVSGDIQPQAYTRVTQMGALDFIKKPSSREEIRDILLRYGVATEKELSPSVELPKEQPELSDTQPNEIHTPTPPLVSKSSRSEADDIIDYRDQYQEIANVAMGRAGDLLARMLGAFVVLPIPNVNILAISELHMALTAVAEDDSISAVCQGYIGAGINGEALLLFHDSSFEDLARLMRYEGDLDDAGQLEVLMDVANILIGACLKGIADQLDMNFSQGHPVVLGQHTNINELIEASTRQWKSKTLAIEINYAIENHNIKCDLLLLFTEDSLPTINNKLIYIIEGSEA
ncbi:response regulator [Celerinatantimonas diazotrophica]|uniref:Response regulator receiver protein n=1 Tax=Celerinatantimonas diazotrophica TaxID=412034 RepID=A0A4V2PNL8_9GAMM|nr:response regulator [Celerinatantimonas diazotrophica]TCK47461.1 response regulator receiver protein [Celerinatantimonas diazotrophica]CAG9296923.1 Protein-glutamate methylesterase/protein-glutamine glutaminase [Celerinatantimonas diazotrophica]